MWSNPTPLSQFSETSLFEQTRILLLRFDEFTELSFSVISCEFIASSNRFPTPGIKKIAAKSIAKHERRIRVPLFQFFNI